MARLRRTDAEQIDSLEGWLTTVVARICLNMLRSRRTRSEQPLDSLRPEPIIDNPAAGTDPEHQARRRVQSAAPVPDRDLPRQRAVVDAYFAAAREGNLDALVAVLDPDVVLRAHRRDGDPLELRGEEHPTSIRSIVYRRTTGWRYPLSRPPSVEANAPPALP